MATKYYLTSVADAWLYDSSDNLVATSKALVDSTFELTTSNTDIRGGKGNPLQLVYFHSPEANITLTDTQFNLDFLAQTVGATLATGANVYTEETVTLGAGGAGTVTGTPLPIQGTALYGWITHDGVEDVERVTFTGSAFTSSVGAENDVVCVRYFAADAAAKELTVYSNIVPNKLRLVLDAQLATKGDTSAAVAGKVEIIVPTLQLSGGFTLSMTADGVAQTPLMGRALETDVSVGGCSAAGVLAYITRVVDNANWYDDVVGLSILGGDIALTHPDTQLISVMALHSDGGYAPAVVADLTFASDTVGTATIDSAGLITTVAAGTTLISATITAKPAIDASVTLTVS